MLSASVDIGEQLAEWLFIINAGGAGCPDQPRRELGALVRYRRRLKLEFLPRVYWRRIAMLRELPQRVEIPVKHQLHCIDR